LEKKVAASGALVDAWGEITEREYALTLYFISSSFPCTELETTREHKKKTPLNLKLRASFVST
jgi:hypothetical protein